jgi:hypothetical protein
MHDPTNGLPRILIPRTWVNKGRKKRERAEAARDPDPLRCGSYPIVGLTSESLWPDGLGSTAGHPRRRRCQW